MEANTIKEKFKFTYGLSLENYIEANDFDQDQVIRTFNRQKWLLEVYCRSWIHSFEYDKLSDARKVIFDDLVLEQIYYVINTFDFTTLSGLDIGTNSTIPQNEIINRYISPVVKEELKNRGFLFRGLW